MKTYYGLQIDIPLLKKWIDTNRKKLDIWMGYEDSGFTIDYLEYIEAIMSEYELKEEKKYGHIINHRVISNDENIEDDFYFLITNPNFENKDVLEHQKENLIKFCEKFNFPNDSIFTKIKR